MISGWWWWWWRWRCACHFVCDFLASFALWRQETRRRYHGSHAEWRIHTAFSMWKTRSRRKILTCNKQQQQQHSTAQLGSELNWTEMVIKLYRCRAFFVVTQTSYMAIYIRAHILAIAGASALLSGSVSIWLKDFGGIINSGNKDWIICKPFASLFDSWVYIYADRASLFFWLSLLCHIIAEISFGPTLIALQSKVRQQQKPQQQQQLQRRRQLQLQLHWHKTKPDSSHYANARAPIRLWFLLRLRLWILIPSPSPARSSVIRLPASSREPSQKQNWKLKT